MTGFIVFDYLDRFPEGMDAMSEWIRAGEIVTREQVATGGRRGLRPHTQSAVRRRQHRQARAGDRQPLTARSEGLVAAVTVLRWRPYPCDDEMTR